jgi:hypothetical protein
VKTSIESKPDLLGDHSVAVPPDSIPNSVVKRNNADGSVGLPHVRVGHRQAPTLIQGFALGKELFKVKPWVESISNYLDI